MPKKNVSKMSRFFLFFCVFKVVTKKREAEEEEKKMSKNPPPPPTTTTTDEKKVGFTADRGAPRALQRAFKKARCAAASSSSFRGAPRFM